MRGDSLIARCPFVFDQTNERAANLPAKHARAEFTPREIHWKRRARAFFSKSPSLARLKIEIKPSGESVNIACQLKPLIRRCELQIVTQ